MLHAPNVFVILYLHYFITSVLIKKLHLISCTSSICVKLLQRFTPFLLFIHWLLSGSWNPTHVSNVSQTSIPALMQLSLLPSQISVCLSYGLPQIIYVRTIKIRIFPVSILLKFHRIYNCSSWLTLQFLITAYHGSNTTQ